MNKINLKGNLTNGKKQVLEGEFFVVNKCGTPNICDRIGVPHLI
jgi:hypothetical protein